MSKNPPAYHFVVGIHTLIIGRGVGGRERTPHLIAVCRLRCSARCTPRESASSIPEVAVKCHTCMLHGGIHDCFFSILALECRRARRSPRNSIWLYSWFSWLPGRSVSPHVNTLPGKLELSSNSFQSRTIAVAAFYPSFVGTFKLPLLLSSECLLADRR